MNLAKMNAKASTIGITVVLVGMAVARQNSSSRSPENHAALGSTLLEHAMTESKLGHYQRASELFSGAIQDDPENPRLYGLRGMTFTLQHLQATLEGMGSFDLAKWLAASDLLSLRQAILIGAVQHQHELEGHAY
jgi:hypothetical protein